MDLRMKRKAKIALDPSFVKATIKRVEEGSMDPEDDALHVGANLKLGNLNCPYMEGMARLSVDEPSLLKDAALGEHTNVGVIAALLLTVSATMLLYGPQNFQENLQHGTAAKHVFVGCAAISFSIFFTSITVASYMFTFTNVIPPEHIHKYMACISHNGLQREPARYMSVGWIVLNIGLCAALYLTWGGVMWVWLAGSSVFFAAVYGCYVGNLILTHFNFMNKEFPKEITEAIAKSPSEGGGQSDLNSLFRAVRSPFWQKSFLKNWFQGYRKLM